MVIITRKKNYNIENIPIYGKDFTQGKCNINENICKLNTIFFSRVVVLI